MRVWILLAAVLCMGLPNGYASGQAPSSVSAPVEREAEEMLEKLRQAYIEGDTQGFFEDTEDAPGFNWLDFRSRIATQSSDFSQRRLLFFVDHTLSENDKVLIRMHWQRQRVRNSTGGVENDEGQAQFIFRKKPSEALKLFDIRGDSPF